MPTTDNTRRHVRDELDPSRVQSLYVVEMFLDGRWQVCTSGSVIWNDARAQLYRFEEGCPDDKFRLNIYVSGDILVESLKPFCGRGNVR